MQDILRREQNVKRRGTAKLESTKCLEAERRRLEAQSQKCEKVKESQSKFVRSAQKRKKNLKALAQKTLDMRADLVLRSVRSARVMAELERREERREAEARDGGIGEWLDQAEDVENKEIVDKKGHMEEMYDN